MSVAQIDMRQMCCSECAVVYWFPEKWCARAQEIGKSWQCPNGHSQWFGESENARLKKQLEKEKACCARKTAQLSELEYQARHPELSEAQHAEAEWLVEHVKGFGWSRAEAAIREFGRVRAFAQATAEEAAHGLSLRLHRSVSPQFAGVLVLRTTEAVMRHGQKLLPAEAGPSNL